MSQEWLLTLHTPAREAKIVLVQADQWLPMVIVLALEGTRVHAACLVLAMDLVSS